MDRNLHPRHASCVRTCRAGVPIRSWLTFGRNSEFPKDKDQNAESESGIRNSEIRT
jgi:hypothetical protein